MPFNLWLIFAIVSQLTATDQVILRDPFENSTNKSDFTWFRNPPWERRSKIKPDNSSIEYFGISQSDVITNESYLESSKITVCNEVILTFYSRVDNANDDFNLTLFLYKENIWKKEWQLMHNNSQWQLNQLKFNVSDRNDNIQFRFIPTLSSSSNTFHHISITIALPNTNLYTNCTNLNQNTKSKSTIHSYYARSTFIHPFIYTLVGSTFVFVFIIVMVIFLYGIINTRYQHWRRKRPNRRGRKGRKTRIDMMEEPTVHDLPSDLV